MHEAHVSPTSERGAAAVLPVAIQLLRDFLAHSEDAFLQTGASLMTLTTRASALVSGGPEAGEEESPVELLARQVGQMRDCLVALRLAASLGAAGMREIQLRIDAVDVLRDDFEAAVQTLPILGLYARIENARPGMCSAGLDSVADDVQQLARGIAPKFEALFQQVTAIRARMRSVGVRTSLLLAEAGATERGIDEANDGLERMRGVWRSVESVSESAAAASPRMVHDAGAVLTALQAHDVTRQRIEHVVEALQARMSDLDASGGETLDPRAEAAILVQIQQVRSAREQFADALQEIQASVEGIAACVRALREQTGGIVGHGPDSPIARVRVGVRRTTETLRAHLLTQRAASDELARVVAAASTMGAHAAAIDGIGGDVKLVAINALIITGQLGDAGNAFSVVAGEIQAVARSLTAETAQVTAALGEIAAAAARLQTTEGFADDVRFAEGEAIVAGMDEVVRRLGELHDAQRIRLDNLANGSAALEAEVATIRARLDGAAARAARLTAVEDALARLVSGDGTGDSMPMPDSYTMEAERAVHRAVAGASEEALPAAGGSELGANVEMF